MKSRLIRVALALVACSGLSLGGVGECDPAVNSTLVAGMNEAALSAAGAIINAAFLTITPGEATPATDDGTGQTGDTGIDATTV